MVLFLSFLQALALTALVAVGLVALVLKGGSA